MHHQLQSVCFNYTFEAAQFAVAVCYHVNVYQFSTLKEDTHKTTELDKHCKDFGMNIHSEAVFLKKEIRKRNHLNLWPFYVHFLWIFELEFLSSMNACRKLIWKSYVRVFVENEF